MAYAEPDANPVLTSLFRVEIDGIQLQSFAEARVSGGDLNKMEDRDGTEPPEVRESSGLRNPWEITLVMKEREGGRGDVLALIVMATNGSKDRRSVAIVTLDHDGAEVGRQSFRTAWVASHEETDHKAEDKDTPITHTFVLSANGRTVT